MVQRKNFSLLLFPFVLLTAFFSPLFIFENAYADVADLADAHSLADLSLEELMEIRITTASLVKEKVSDTPASVRVVTRKQISERGYRNVEDLLKDLPGFSIQDHQSPEWNFVNVRGVTGNNKLMVLMDGVRIGLATNSPETPISDNYPLYNVRQVEILYGPASAIYGADAFNGVINLVTRNGAEIDGGSVTVEGGDFNYKRVEAFGGRRLSDNVALSVGGHFGDSQGPDLSKYFPGYFNLTDLSVGNTVVEPAAQRSGYNGHSRSYSAYAKLELGESWQTGFFQTYTELPSSADGKPALNSWDGNPYIGRLQSNLYAKWHGNVAGKLDGDFDASYSRSEVTPGSSFVNTYSNFQSAYKYERGERFRLEPRVTWEGGKDSVVAGITAEWFSSIPLTPDLATPYNTSVGPSQQNQYIGGTNNTIPVKLYQLYYENQSVYFQWKYSILNNLFSTVGVRADQNSDYGSNVNPRLGLVFQPSEAQSYKIMYGQAFLAPSPMQRYRVIGAFSGTNAQGLYTSGFFWVPNPNLRPETVATYELGADFKPAKETNVQFNLYYSKVSDLILGTSTPTVQSNFIPGGTISYTSWYDNIGGMDAYGLDMSAEHKIIMGGSRVDLWFNSNWVNGGLLNNSMNSIVPLPRVATISANFGLTYVMENRLVITPSVRWVGDTNTWQQSTSSPDYGIKVPSYWDTSLYAEYKIVKDNFSVFARINNLLDQRYYNASGGLDTSYALNPQDPRWIMGGLKYQF